MSANNELRAAARRMSAKDGRRDELAHAWDAAWDVAWDAGIEAARSDHYDMRPLNQRNKAREEYLAEWADKP